MAFAQNQNGNGAATPFVTEKDLVRQVASNLTKEALISTKETRDGATTEKLQSKNVADSKRLMAENLAKALKVWYSFVKFVKNQVTVNGRLVDTQLIGLFGKDENGDVLYMPSPDYLEAGKFKLQRGQGSLFSKLGLDEAGTNLMESYRDKYQQKLQSTSKGEQSVLSFASLSLVTNSTKEQVKRTLTDFFTALIDVSRKTGKEAQIKMKGFGTIYLFKNRELAFNPQDDSVDLAKLDANNKSLFEQRQRDREDLSYIDQASAVLSRGGGMAYSVKSSAIKSISSVMTAPTNPSVRSSVIQSSRGGYARSSYSTQTGGSRKQAISKKDDLWARYKKKNEDEARQRQLRKSQSVHGTPASERRSYQSVPKSINSELQKKRMLAPNAVKVNMNVHTNAPTTIPDLMSAPNVFASPEESSAKSQTLQVDHAPYPFLPGFVDRKMGNRFSKRVVFDHSDYDDLLGKIIGQIHEKKDRELIEKLREREDEQGLLHFQREMMQEERHYEHEDKVHKTNAFIQANQILKDEKDERKSNEQRMKSIERVSYFPFTHGDMIEKQRKALNELQKHEQLNAIKERAQDELQRKRNQARLNAEANQQMLLSFQKQVIMEQMAKQRPRKSPIATQNEGEQISAAGESANASPGRPNLFLKNSSANLPPRRQQLAVSNAEIKEGEEVGGNQYQLAMSEALARHEAELMRVGELRKIQEKDFRQQVKMQDEIVAAEKEQEKFKKVQLHQELSSQMREAESKRAAEKQQRKDKVLTSGGPTMQVEDSEALNKKFKDQQLLTRLNLSKQREMEEMERKARREIEVSQERADAERIAAKHLEAKMAKQEQKKQTLEHFKSVWEVQKTLKSKNEEMENCF